MKKYPIGFNTRIKEEPKKETAVATYPETVQPKKSVVQVYFPHRGMGWAYYNDSFDLKVGDFVYVEGKLEGYRGQVTEVNYSFKIKLSDYKKVIAVVDTNVNGDFYLAGSHLVTFDRNAIPYEKVLTWFKAPESDEEYASGNDETKSFPLDDLSKMNISHDIADRGHDYYIENRVSYVCIDRTRGHAIVEGCENYEIEFDYTDGEISNYRVDKMETIELTEDDRVLSDKPFDLSNYSKTMFQMFSGEETDVSIEFDNELVGVVFDRFGTDIPIVKKDENHFICHVKVAVSPHFLSWIMSFGKQAKIISPDYVVEEMYQLARDITKIYKR